MLRPGWQTEEAWRASGGKAGTPDISQGSRAFGRRAPLTREEELARGRGHMPSHITDWGAAPSWEAPPPPSPRSARQLPEQLVGAGVAEALSPPLAPPPHSGRTPPSGTPRPYANDEDLRSPGLTLPTVFDSLHGINALSDRPSRGCTPQRSGVYQQDTTAEEVEGLMDHVSGYPIQHKAPPPPGVIPPPAQGPYPTSVTPASSEQPTLGACAPAEGAAAVTAAAAEMQVPAAEVDAAVSALLGTLSSKLADRGTSLESACARYDVGGRGLIAHADFMRMVRDVGAQPPQVTPHRAGHKHTHKHKHGRPAHAHPHSHPHPHPHISPPVQDLVAALPPSISCDGSIRYQVAPPAAARHMDVMRPF